MQADYIIQNTGKNQWFNFQDIQQELGWDPLFRSQNLFQATDPDGCFFGKINGEIISSITAMKYSKKYGFIGVYWVKTQYRGKGYGLKIFQKAMEYLKDCEIIGLDAVKQQIHNYQKSGFKFHSNSIEGHATKPAIDPILVKSLIKTNKKDIDIKEITEFDSKYFPSDRTRFLQKGFELGFPIVSYDPQSKKVLGYGVVNKRQHGVTLAPLVAEQPQIAEQIIQTMFDHHKTDSYVLFYNDEHKHIEQTEKKWFPEVTYNCQRMYYKAQNFKSDFDRSHIYGMTSYERG